MARMICGLLLIAFAFASGCNRGQVVTCGQTVITGRAGTKQYDTEQACVEDRAKQQEAAEADGIAQCTKFCTGLGADCKPQPAPKPPKATAACKKVDNKWQATVETGPFDCICKKSS